MNSRNAGGADARETMKALAARYPQLLLPIREGISKTEEYKNVVLGGEKSERTLEGDWYAGVRFFSCATPAGEAEILLFPLREGFERAYRALAYRCEPAPIPPSVGAAAVSGLINWEKIRSHHRAYLDAGGTDWEAEFERFTAVQSNYRDALILLSSGPYSAVPPPRPGMTGEEWDRRSVRIRMYHELTHFICRRLMPEKRDALRDEVYADCMGLIGAFGAYDPRLAEQFLGVENERCRAGGRLEHYTDLPMEERIGLARRWIGEASARTAALWRSRRPEEWDAAPENEKSALIFDLLPRCYGDAGNGSR